MRIYYSKLQSQNCSTLFHFDTNKHGFIQVLPLILLAAFAITTLVIANRVQTQQEEIRSQAAGTGCSGLRPNCASGYTLKCNAPNWTCEKTAPAPAANQATEQQRQQARDAALEKRGGALSGSQVDIQKTQQKILQTIQQPKPVPQTPTAQTGGGGGGGVPQPAAAAPTAACSSGYDKCNCGCVLHTALRDQYKSSCPSYCAGKSAKSFQNPALTASQFTGCTIQCRGNINCIWQQCFGRPAPQPTTETKYHYDINSKQCVIDNNGESLAECKREQGIYTEANAYTNCIQGAQRDFCESLITTYGLDVSDLNNPTCKKKPYGVSKEDCDKQLTAYQQRQTAAASNAQNPSCTGRGGVCRTSCTAPETYITAPQGGWTNCDYVCCRPASAQTTAQSGGQGITTEVCTYTIGAGTKTLSVGQTTCEGNKVYGCIGGPSSAGGQDLATIPCDNGCESGRCKAATAQGGGQGATCTMGPVICGTGENRVCNTPPYWSCVAEVAAKATQCTYADGTVLDPNQNRCTRDGRAVHQCDANGNPRTDFVCQSGQFCDNGACVTERKFRYDPVNVRCFEDPSGPFSQIQCDEIVATVRARQAQTVQSTEGSVRRTSGTVWIANANRVGCHAETVPQGGALIGYSDQKSCEAVFPQTVAQTPAQGGGQGATCTMGPVICGTGENRVCNTPPYWSCVAEVAPVSCTLTSDASRKLVAEGRIVCNNGQTYDCCSLCTNGINTSGKYPQCKSPTAPSAAVGGGACASGWQCGTTCASAKDVSDFTAVYCDPKSQWLYEAGNALSTNCGGAASKLKSQGCAAAPVAAQSVAPVGPKIGDACRSLFDPFSSDCGSCPGGLHHWSGARQFCGPEQPSNYAACLQLASNTASGYVRTDCEMLFPQRPAAPVAAQTAPAVGCPDATRIAVLKTGPYGACALGGEYDCCAFCPQGTTAGTGDNVGLCVPVNAGEASAAREACRGKKSGDCSSNGNLCAIFQGIVYETAQKCPVAGGGTTTCTDIQKSLRANPGGTCKEGSIDCCSFCTYGVREGTEGLSWCKMSYEQEAATTVTPEVSQYPSCDPNTTPFEGLGPRGTSLCQKDGRVLSQCQPPAYIFDGTKDLNNCLCGTGYTKNDKEECVLPAAAPTTAPVKPITASAIAQTVTHIGVASKQVVALFCKVVPFLTVCKQPVTKPGTGGGAQAPSAVSTPQPEATGAEVPSGGGAQPETGGAGETPSTAGGGGGAPSAACSYGSTQARVQKDITDTWKQTMTIGCEGKFIVGSFHNGTGQFANDTQLLVTSPSEFSLTFQNGATVSAMMNGTYRFRVTTPGQSGAACTGQASVIVNCMPGPGKCSTNPIRYPVEGVGWCEASGVRCLYKNSKVTQLPDPWCDLEGVPSSTCTGPDQRANTNVQCTRPTGTSCGDKTCQGPLENWETCPADCPYTFTP